MRANKYNRGKKKIKKEQGKVKSSFAVIKVTGFNRPDFTANLNRRFHNKVQDSITRLKGHDTRGDPQLAASYGIYTMQQSSRTHHWGFKQDLMEKGYALLRKTQ